MHSLKDIKAELETPATKTTAQVVQNIDPHAAIAQEVVDLRIAVESILIWLKLTSRLSEAQYNFVFGHVAETKKGEDEEFEIFLTRSAIELEDKMRNAGLM